MRDFFINSFEILVGVVIVILAIVIVIAAGAVAFGGGQGMMMNGQPMGGGPLAGWAVLVGGALYLVFIGGLMYLGLGIYQNTKRTAAAMERLADR